MKQNYPSQEMLKQSGDRITQLLKKAAQPVQPDFATDVRGYLNTRLAGFYGKDTSNAYQDTVDTYKKDKQNEVDREVAAETNTYNLLVKQRDAGNAEAEKILNVASKLSGNDPEQMSRLIQEGFKRFPDGDITLTDAVNLAGELGIKPKPTEMDALKTELMRSQINKNNAIAAGGGIDPYQAAQLRLAQQRLTNQANAPLVKEQAKQIGELKVKASSAKELINKLNILAEKINKTGSDQGPIYGLPVVGTAMRGTAALTGMDSEKNRRNLEAQINQLQGLMSGMRKGQGAVSDYERSMYEKMGPRITNDAETNMMIIQDLIKEANDTIQQYNDVASSGSVDPSYNAGGSIDSTLSNQGGGSMLPSRQPGKSLAEIAAGDEAIPTGGSVSAPQPGMVEDGYKFKGGDPADPSNWEAM